MSYKILDLNEENKKEVEFVVDREVLLFICNNAKQSKNKEIVNYVKYIKDLAKLMYSNKYINLKLLEGQYDLDQLKTFEFIKACFYGIRIE